jgi:hypothetical protein
LMNKFINLISMKKLISICLAITIVIMASCNKTDKTAPVITLKGNNPDVVVWGSAAKYIEPGAVVTDEVDGKLDYTVDSTVNMLLAGSYTVTYTATDAAENKATATRTVIVDAAPYLQGNFSVDNYIGLVFQSMYNDTLSVTTNYNELKFKHFSVYQNVDLIATISGTGITIPLQTDSLGTPPRPIIFSGSGSFASDTAFSINYTITDTTTTFSGHIDYKAN